MEITLMIDGKQKHFTQDKVNYLTIRKAMEWNENFKKEVNAFNEYLKSGIEGEYDPELLEFADKKTDPEQLKETADLVVAYFNGQFTFDDFISGYFVKTISQFHELGLLIVYEIYDQLGKTNKNTEKKS